MKHTNFLQISETMSDSTSESTSPTVLSQGISVQVPAA